MHLAIRSTFLKLCLKSDLKFKQHQFHKIFKTFLTHAMKLSEAFQFVHDGNPTANTSYLTQKSHGGCGIISGDASGKSKLILKLYMQPLICLYKFRKERSSRHFLNICKKCPEDKKNSLFKSHYNDNMSAGLHDQSISNKQ